jgi:hypothetical protein
MSNPTHLCPGNHNEQYLVFTLWSGTTPNCSPCSQGQKGEFFNGSTNCQKQELSEHIAPISGLLSHSCSPHTMYFYPPSIFLFIPGVFFCLKTQKDQLEQDYKEGKIDQKEQAIRIDHMHQNLLLY